MALDGIVIANIRQELEQTLLGGRLYKIAQPETDELLFTIKTPKQQYRLVISANASLPLIYLSEENKPVWLLVVFIKAHAGISQQKDILL